MQFVFDIMLELLVTQHPFAGSLTVLANFFAGRLLRLHHLAIACTAAIHTTTLVNRCPAIIAAIRIAIKATTITGAVSDVIIPAGKWIPLQYYGAMIRVVHINAVANLPSPCIIVIILKGALCGSAACHDDHNSEKPQ